MPTALRQYDAKLDSKKRLTIRTNNFEYYRVTERDDGTILLEPRELTPPFTISARTLEMIDKAAENLKAGKVSPAVDLSMFDGD